MHQRHRLAVLEAWMDAGFGQADWSSPLSLSISPMGARALALARARAEGGLQMIGSSVGAPVEFLNLCRELGEASLAPGVQERHVPGLGRIAWSTVAGGGITLFALYHDEADLEALGEHALMAEKCVAARARFDGSRAASSLKSVALARLPLGVAILDRKGRCCEVNEAARAIANRNDGLTLVAGVLSCSDPVDRAALRRAVLASVEDERDVFTRVRRPGAARPYVLRAIGRRVPEQDVRYCLLMIVDPDAPPSAAPEIWRAMFNLTECEILVATALLSGCNVADLARRRGVAVDTVRQQKKSMFARLEVSSQAAAAAILSRVAAFAAC